jgi:hypothetical protein
MINVKLNDMVDYYLHLANESVKIFLREYDFFVLYDYPGEDPSPGLILYDTFPLRVVSQIIRELRKKCSI